MEHIIKTTARLEEGSPVLKQRPIIQVDKAAGGGPREVRLSLDSGRDNPFKPDGEIYKSAEPIVDFYRAGLNQSRSRTPTPDNQLQLLLGPAPPPPPQADPASQPAPPAARRSAGCWRRRWLCCGCGCTCCPCERAPKKAGTRPAQQDECRRPAPEAGEPPQEARDEDDDDDDDELERTIREVAERLRLEQESRCSKNSTPLPGGGGGGGGDPAADQAPADCGEPQLHALDHHYPAHKPEDRQQTLDRRSAREEFFIGLAAPACALKESAAPFGEHAPPEVVGEQAKTAASKQPSGRRWRLMFWRR